jgi:hypothetical protein
LNATRSCECWLEVGGRVSFSGPAHLSPDEKTKKLCPSCSISGREKKNFVRRRSNDGGGGGTRREWPGQQHPIKWIGSRWCETELGAQTPQAKDNNNNNNPSNVLARARSCHANLPANAFRAAHFGPVPFSRSFDSARPFIIGQQNRSDHSK